MTDNKLSNLFTYFFSHERREKMGRKGQISILFWIIILIVGVIALNLGISPIISLAQHATSLIGILCAIVGLYLIVTKKEQKEIFGLSEGYLLLIIGAGLSIGSLFFELLQMIFGNTLIMITILVFLFIYLGKKAGWIE